MGLLTTWTAGLLLVLACVAAEEHTNSALNAKEGSTASAQYGIPEHYGADRHRYERDDEDVHNPRAPDEYEDDSAYKRYMPDYDGQASKAADPVGQTYMMSTFRRTLSRPASTTLRQLAEATPPLDLSAQRSSPQEREPREVLKAVRNHSLKPPPHRNTTAPNGQVQAGKLVHPRMPGDAAATASYGSPTAEVTLSFNSLSAFDATVANGGNQYVSGVPDQALCVGNGYVMAAVNTVLTVYDAATGQPQLVNPLAINTFYGFPAEFNRTSGVAGPFAADPSCAYDKNTQRWFFVIFYQEQTPEGVFSGPSSLEVAVSDGPDPTGSWSYFTIPTTNNGSQGTPDFGCSSGSCFADFPQMAVWEHALVITANVFDTFNYDFAGAAVYAVDKAALIAGSSNANTALVRTRTTATDLALFTLIPATQVGHCSTPNTYLVATPVLVYAGLAQHTLHLLSLQGTETLASQHARVTLDWVNREVALDVSYAFPPPATQKPGSIPLGNVEYSITTPNLLSADARMASVSFVDDKLYCAWGSAVQGEGDKTVAGVAWALLDPHMPKRALTSGLLGATGGNHLLMPYLAVRPGGLGVMAVSIAGPDFYPTAAYATLTEDGLGQLTQVAAGVGPLDGFSGYYQAPWWRVERFGDYAAARVDEHGAFWIGSEYSGQTCSPEQFSAASPVVGMCDKTRIYWCNWYTRITKVAWDASK